MIKKILLSIAILAIAPFVIYAALVLNNNLGDDSIETGQIKDSLEHATEWLVANQESVLNENNPMLWWMIKRSFETTQDYRLGELYSAYKQRYLDGDYDNYWRLLFEPDFRTMLMLNRIERLPDYNQYFLYSLSCDEQLKETEIIQRQLTTDFCPTHHPISPACITHQMMGLYFRQQRNCGEPAELAGQMTDLQGTVYKQLTWDPRVVDVYIQRVLMLVDTGAKDKIKGRWLHRLLDAQLADGSWSGFRPWLPIGSDRHLGFYAKGITVSKPEGNFHATAQGILLMSLLATQTPEAKP